MAKIKTIKDSSNQIIYPQTVLSAVYNSSNKTLEELLSDIYTKDEVNAAIQQYVEEAILGGAW